MASDDKRLDRLDNALRDLHRRLEDPEVADEESVMRRVRRARRPAPGRPPASFERAEAGRLFARFAAGAALAAVLAALYAMTAGYGPEYELARIYALDPAGMLLMPLLGV